MNILLKKARCSGSLALSRSCHGSVQYQTFSCKYPSYFCQCCPCALRIPQIFRPLYFFFFFSILGLFQNCLVKKKSEKCRKKCLHIKLTYAPTLLFSIVITHIQTLVVEWHQLSHSLATEQLRQGIQPGVYEYDELRALRAGQPSCWRDGNLLAPSLGCEECGWKYPSVTCWRCGAARCRARAFCVFCFGSTFEACSVFQNKSLALLWSLVS